MGSAYSEGNRVTIGSVPEQVGVRSLWRRHFPHGDDCHRDQSWVLVSDATVAGSLAGAMTMTKSGTGSLTIETSNTYSGGTILTEGTLFLSTDTAIGLAGRAVAW